LGNFSADAAKSLEYYIIKLYPFPAPPKKERSLASWLYEQPYYLRLHRFYRQDELAELTQFGPERIAGAVSYESDILKAQRFENLDQAHGLLDVFANWQAKYAETGPNNVLFFQHLEIIKYTPEVMYSGKAHLARPGIFGKLEK